MAWMNRYLQPSALLIGAAIASCTTTEIPQDGTAGAGGTGLTGAMGGTGGSGGTTGGTSSCVPGINCPGDAGGTAGSGGSVTSGGSGGSVMTGGIGGGAGSGVGGGPPLGGTGSGTAGVDASGGVPPVAGSGGSGVGGSDPTGGTAGTTATISHGSIIVSANALARDHSIVRFPLAGLADKNLVLKGTGGETLPLQISKGDGQAYFILPALAAGMQATYTIEELPAAPANTITTSVNTTDMQLYVKNGDTTVFRWMLLADNFRNRNPNDVRAGYIYPLYTPTGVSVADDYAEDHPHMHGIWSAWTLTTFRGNKVDFWNGYDNSGHNDLESMELAWSGTVNAGFIAHIKHEAIKYTPWVKVLSEKWTVHVYKTHDGAAPYNVFDYDSIQEAATTDPLVLEEYHYGGFGFRGSEEWQGATGCTFLTSEGRNRSNGDGTRAKWNAMYGTVGGKVGGYAAFSAPTNFRHPQGLRLHPSNPYWSFTPVTVASGGVTTINPGTPFVSRYRIVVFDGAADAATLNRLYDDFATPPTVEVIP